MSSSSISVGAFRRADHVAWRALGEETIVVDLRSNRMYGLNATAGRVWETLANATRPESLASEFGLDGSAHERASELIGEFLTELSSTGLIEPCDASESDEHGATYHPTASTDFEPPKILFREEIRNFGQSANMICFQDPSCDQGCG